MVEGDDAPGPAPSLLNLGTLDSLFLASDKTSDQEDQANDNKIQHCGHLLVFLDLMKWCLVWA